jgi:cytochrome c biogenesis protein ResB
VALYIPLVLFVVALVTCFLAIDYIRRGEAARTGPARLSKRQLRKMRRHRGVFG